MKNVRFLSTAEYRELIRAVQSHPQMLPVILLNSMSGQRCSAPSRFRGRAKAWACPATSRGTAASAAMSEAERCPASGERTH